MRAKKIIVTLLTLLFMLIAAQRATARVYPIVEPDLLSEVKQRGEDYVKNRWPEDRKRLLNKIRHFHPWKPVILKPATKNYSYTVSLTYTLPYDIPRVDKNGKVVGVLYPKGFTFNPLNYLLVDPPTLVVFNGKRRVEVEWVKKNWVNKTNVMLLITDGDWLDLDNELKRPVFFLPPVIAQKLRLKNTVSVIYRDKKDRSLMRVDVVRVAPEKSKGKKIKKKGVKE